MKCILAIESSCDDTSVAIVIDGYVKACLSADQNKVHTNFGGIVPEIASRNHTHYLQPIMDEVLKLSGINLKDINGVAATYAPGLIGSLIVGLVSGKSLAMALEVPFIGVHHLEGHLIAPLLRDEQYQPPNEFSYPYLALLVSGGHTAIYAVEEFGKYKLFGETRDDAAGEAFDKFGKMIGFGFPGGIWVDRAAKFGDMRQFAFPRAMSGKDNFDFSFSGLKTSALKICQQLTLDEKNSVVEFLKTQKLNLSSIHDKKISDLCASYQEAIVDPLIEKLEKVFLQKNYPYKGIALTGGVACNSRLRERTENLARQLGTSIAIAPPRYCTDNAAMIGLVGLEKLKRGITSPLNLAPLARCSL